MRSRNSPESGKVLHLASSGEISVYTENLCQWTSYSYKVHPVQSNFLHYFGAITDTLSNSRGHEFVIMSSYDNTNVSIISSQGQNSLTIMLQKYQVYAFYSQDVNDVVEILSDKPVAVVSSYICVDLGVGACDAAVSQLLPVPLWSNQYLSPLFQEGSTALSSYLTIISTDNDNQITTKNSLETNVTTLQKYDYYMPTYQQSAYNIQCSMPCYAQLFVQGILPVSRNFDPALIYLRSFETGTNKVAHFANLDTNSFILSSYLALITDANAKSSIALDGSTLNANWMSIPGSNYSYTNIQIITESTHNISFTGQVMGYLFQYSYWAGFVRAIL